MYRVRHKVSQELIQVWGVYSDNNILYFVFYDKETKTWYHDDASNYTLWG